MTARWQYTFRLQILKQKQRQRRYANDLESPKQMTKRLLAANHCTGDYIKRLYERVQVNKQTIQKEMQSKGYWRIRHWEYKRRKRVADNPSLASYSNSITLRSSEVCSQLLLSRPDNLPILYPKRQSGPRRFLGE